MQIPVFIQFLSSFYNYHYYSIIWNTNQRTTISYLVSVKRRLLPKILFNANVRLRGDDLVKSAETYSSIYIQCCVDRTLQPIKNRQSATKIRYQCPAPHNLRIYSLHEGEYFEQTIRRTHFNRPCTDIQIFCIATDQNN